jgi:hypothetical protein
MSRDKSSNGNRNVNRDIGLGLEVQILLNRERDWERRAKELARITDEDKRALLRGARSAFLLAVPFWVWLAWWLGR